MRDYNEEIKVFNELIDPKSKPVYKLAQYVGVTPENVYDILRDAYDNANENDELISDSSGIAFTTEFADILLVRNTDFSSRYERYLVFNLNDEYIDSHNQSEDSSSVVPDTLDNVILPPKNLVRLNKFLHNIEEMPSDKEINQLKENYIKCRKDDALVPHEDGYNFATKLTTYNGFQIIAGIKPTKTSEGRNTWLLNYIGFDNKATDCDVYESDIDKFAGVHRSTYIEDTKRLAREEKWFFGDESEKNDILKNYLDYTFHKIKLEGKIAYSCDGKLAAINTGLADKSSSDIYMCFEKDDQDSQYEWRYSGVCTAAHGRRGKMLVSNFHILPEPAQYISRKEDVIYDTEKKLFPDMEHILLDRIHRIPIDFLKKVLSDYPEAIKIIETIEICDGDYVLTLFEELADYLSEDEDAFDCLSNAFEGVVNKALKALRFDFRLAIPCYFLKRDVMSLLLPLDFTDSGVPQAAIVAELTPTGNYIGHTILTMKQAYIDARLISRQDISWLRA